MVSPEGIGALPPDRFPAGATGRPALDDIRAEAEREAERLWKRMQQW